MSYSERADFCRMMAQKARVTEYAEQWLRMAGDWEIIASMRANTIAQDATAAAREATEAALAESKW